MFIEIIKIKRVQKDGTCTCHVKQWPTPPSHSTNPTLEMKEELNKNKECLRL
jgi:hypothetical protein